MAVLIATGAEAVADTHADAKLLSTLLLIEVEGLGGSAWAGAVRLDWLARAR